MKKEPITIIVSKEKQATYQSSTPDFETLRYKEVGKPWWINTKREVGGFLENVSQSLRKTGNYLRVTWQELPLTFLVKWPVKLIGYSLIAAKDFALVVFYIVLSLLEFGWYLLEAIFKSIRSRPQTSRAKAKTYQPPLEEEWWRKPSKPPASKKTRTIRVIVEVEDY